MPRSLLSPITLPTTLWAYAVGDASPTCRNIRVSLGNNATPSDSAAVFVCDDTQRTGATLTKRFSATDLTTWPPGCVLVAVVTGSGVAYVPEEAWGGAVVVERIAGSTADLDVLISGEGAQGSTDLAAPTTVGNWAAVDVSAFSGPAQIVWDRNATTADAVSLYLSDDPTLTTGSGVPPAEFLCTLTGGDKAVEIPAVKMATQIIARRTLGTGSRFLLVRGRSSYDAGVTASGPLNITAQGVNISSGPHDVLIDSSGGVISIAASDGGVLLLLGKTTLTGSLALTKIDVPTTAVNGPIGAKSAEETVDAGTFFRVNQTDASKTLTLQPPSDPSRTIIAIVANVGSQSFTMYSKTVAAGTLLLAMWTGAAWATLA